jgi:hypothetical protein
MSNRQARRDRRTAARDEQRRQQAKAAPTEWARLTGRQKRRVARQKRRVARHHGQRPRGAA